MNKFNVGDRVKQKSCFFGEITSPVAEVTEYRLVLENSFEYRIKFLDGTFKTVKENELKAAGDKPAYMVR